MYRMYIRTKKRLYARFDVHVHRYKSIGDHPELISHVQFSRVVLFETLLLAVALQNTVRQGATVPTAGNWRPSDGWLMVAKNCFDESPDKT